MEFYFYFRVFQQNLAKNKKHLLKKKKAKTVTQQFLHGLVDLTKLHSRNSALLYQRYIMDLFLITLYYIKIELSKTSALQIYSFFFQLLLNEFYFIYQFFSFYRIKKISYEVLHQEQILNSIMKYHIPLLWQHQQKIQILKKCVSSLYQKCKKYCVTFLLSSHYCVPCAATGLKT